ncbi:hypothetical protein IAD21_00613 [Abditibacteriota bacterium]|nr:hypothetical protein IAD21_00613 [Abditibacteriota bacterium]
MEDNNSALESLIQQVEQAFVPFTHIAKECGSKTKPYTWSNYHGYFPKIVVFGVNVTPRVAYDEFKRDHADLFSPTNT